LVLASSSRDYLFRDTYDDLYYYLKEDKGSAYSTYWIL